VTLDTTDVRVDLGGVSVAFDWKYSVAGLALSVPGLLLILLLLLQAGAGSLWLPLVRRHLGWFGRRPAASEDTRP
jgi:hypothetical protein